MDFDYSLLIPEYFLIIWAILVMAVELFFPRLRKDVPAYLAALGAIVALGISLYWVDETEAFGNLLSIDNYTTFFRVLLYGIAALICIASAQFVRRRLDSTGEYYGLILIGTVGGVGMAAATEMLTAWVSLEMLSFTLYILVSFAKRDLRSNEGGLKYMLLGAFSTALFLYGLSLIYGVTGNTTYAGIAEALQGPAADLDLALLMGLVFVVAGLGFKVSAVPFHVWAPDAYQGAPLPITAYISTTSKAAGFALFLRFFIQAFMPVVDDWRWLLATISAATIIFGNLLALQQTNLKRLLAYSSIAQVGFLLIGIAAATPEASATLLFHLAGYIVTNLALFIAFIAYFNVTGDDEIDGMRGLAERQPLLALVMTVSLFSLAGMPIFAGFFSKMFLFQAGWQAGLEWLAIIAVVGSLISLYYYLLVMKQMYMYDPPREGRISIPAILSGTVAILMVAVIALGVYPTPLIEAADNAGRLIF
ncbi:MAG: NADH-quinone oxidoreductase subunit N [Dehalococcoidia bacterium]